MDYLVFCSIQNSDVEYSLVDIAELCPYNIKMGFIVIVWTLYDFLYYALNSFMNVYV